MADEASNEVNKPFRIGIFWETETEAFLQRNTKEFLSTLVDGLLDLEKPPEVVLCVRPEDRVATAELEYQSGSRLQTVVLRGGRGLEPGRETIVRKVGRLVGFVGKAKKAGLKLHQQGRSRISTEIQRVFAESRTKLRESPAAGFLFLALGAFLGAGLFLLYWCLYTVAQLARAAIRSLVFPLRISLKIAFLRRYLDHLKLSLDPLISAKEANCDVWLVPSLDFPHSLHDLKSATVIIIPDNLEQVAQIRNTARAIATNRVAEANLCVRMSPGTPDEHEESLLQLDPNKIRNLPSAKAQEWMKIFQEAAEIAAWRGTLDHQVISSGLNRPRWRMFLGQAMASVRWRTNLDRQLAKPWPSLETALPLPHEPLKVFLFLPQVYYGGVLQVTRELVSELAAVNRLRQRLHLTLGLLEDQGGTQFLDQLDKAVDMQRMRLNPIRRQEVVRLCGGMPAWLTDRPEHEFCFMSGAAQAAFQADAWFSLIDRFPLPLLPVRPFGILVQDVIQRVHPEIFGMVFFRNMSAGIIPTARSADVIVTGTTQTRDDVITAYGVDPARVHLVPVACNPEWHFSQVTPRLVANVREPFILNVTNCSPHKGADVILPALAMVKRRLGNQAPFLVMCGYATDGFSKAHGKYHGKPWQTIRRLVRDLGLVEGRDVVFLGTVDDGQLHYLYQHCRVVVNAARYDNGCLCLAEGAYFGKPAISSRYAAAEFHAQRFGYDAHFFPIGDPESLAESIVAALQQPLATQQDISHARSRFLDPEFSFRRYSERIYDLLIQMAEKGRSQKTTSQLRMSA
jgi:glycosyltransferase involved in cell wall biosynthesis